MSCLFEPIHGKFPTHSICDLYPDCVGCSYLDSSKQPKQTNADRIRNMTDEELAKYFSYIAECDSCPNELDRECCVSEDACINKWLKWMKQETD